MLLTLSVPVPLFNVSDSAEPPVVPTALPDTVNAPLVVVKLIADASASVKLPPMLKVSAEVFVVMLFARLTLPEVEKLPPVTEMAPVEESVKRPELVTAKLPAVVVKLLFKLNVVPVKLAEPTLTVLLKSCAPPLVVKLVRAVPLPTAPEKVIPPLPLLIVRPCAPSNVLPNETLLFVVVNVRGFVVIVTGLL